MLIECLRAICDYFKVKKADKLEILPVVPIIEDQAEEEIEVDEEMPADDD